MSLTLGEKVGSLLYLVSPNRTSFEHYRDVPNYINESIPIFGVLVFTEMFIRWLMGKENRLNDTITSGLVGLIHESTVYFSSIFMLIGYEWLYQYRIFELPWNSLYTWFGAFVFVDFCYYWIHRANHEVNILWAAHQVHHSQEDYNYSTALRISMFQRAAYIGFYQPLALIGFPLSSVGVHAALNLLFQFWVHTEIIDNLGPLEYIFNTPSHHRVHHGVNKWCLDKNYGSVFIIWDRIFGTFEPERKGEAIVYGLTDQPQTFNVLWHEVFYFGIIYKKFKSAASWSDSLKAIFYGPGWCPGAPRLGDPNTFPNIKAPRAKYDPQVPKWKLAYIVFHGSLAAVLHHVLVTQLFMLSSGTVLLYLTFIFSTVGIIGGMFDGKRWAGILEALRCALLITYGALTPLTGNATVNSHVITYFTISVTIWVIHNLVVFRPSLKLVSE
ncbi:alkylglycerol monooxygenase-like [Macrobrachium rosenbergii]|uniref:alkylglycerol monooxygenase-like n=1 Tax=Macrobrachium rosenbergii TaxID=79674 RepID=UPI0034D6EBC6